MLPKPDEALRCRICHWSEYGPLGSRCPDDTHGFLLADEDLARYRDDPLLGTTLMGRYVVLGVLGQGGMGIVYRAIQPTLMNREVAVKVIWLTAEVPLARQAELRARFTREAQILAHLNDPAIVTLFDYWEDQRGRQYMVLERVHGDTLTSLCKREVLEPPRVAHLMSEVLRGLHAGHEAGVVHRDMKPDNILIGERDGVEQPKIIDLGVAKAEELPSLTASGRTCGSPESIAPEQAQGEPVDARADVYAVGTIIYWCLTRKLPFSGPTIPDMLYAKCTERAPELPADFPQDMREVVSRALETRPEDRFTDAAQMRRALMASV